MSQKTAGLFQRVLARPPRAEIDPADLGTCFGLECSLAADVQPTAPPAQDHRAGWMRRLTLLGRAAF